MSVHELRLSPFDDRLRVSSAMRHDAAHALEQPAPAVATPEPSLHPRAAAAAVAAAPPVRRRARPGLYGTPRRLLLGRWSIGQLAWVALVAAVAAIALGAARAGEPIASSMSASGVPAGPLSRATQRVQPRRASKRVVRERRPAPVRRAARPVLPARQPAAPPPASRPAPAPARPSSGPSSFSGEFSP